MIDTHADVWQSGDATLYCGDCLEILPKLCKVDALVTDPPYGIGWSRGSWDDSPDSYAGLMRWLVAEANRLVASGYVFVFQAMKRCADWADWFPSGWRIFAACKNFAQIRPTGVWHSWDPVIFWRNGPKSVLNTEPNSGHVKRDYHVGNVSGCFRENAEHPCPRPVDTMEHIVQLAADQGGAILDPFMGSGTTGVACVRTGRKFIGIEIEPKYFEIAKARIRKAQEELSLFEKPPEVRQSTLRLEPPEAGQGPSGTARP